MHWLLLFIATAGIGWAVGLKYRKGSRALSSVLTVVALRQHVAALAVRHLPLGTAYAVWTGIGTVGAAALGIILFKEPAGALRIMCIALIVVGIIGLKFTASRPAL